MQTDVFSSNEDKDVIINSCEWFNRTYIATRI